MNVTERIEKLLALAQSTDSEGMPTEEARTAAVQAARLMARHGYVARPVGEAPPAPPPNIPAAGAAANDTRRMATVADRFKEFVRGWGPIAGAAILDSLSEISERNKLAAVAKTLAGAPIAAARSATSRRTELTGTERSLFQVAGAFAELEGAVLELAAELAAAGDDPKLEQYLENVLSSGRLPATAHLWHGAEARAPRPRERSARADDADARREARRARRERARR